MVRMISIPTRVRHIDDELPEIAAWRGIRRIVFITVSSEIRMKLLVNAGLAILRSHAMDLQPSRLPVWAVAIEDIVIFMAMISCNKSKAVWGPRVRRIDDDEFHHDIQRISALTRGLVAPVLWTNYIVARPILPSPNCGAPS